MKILSFVPLTNAHLDKLRAVLPGQETIWQQPDAQFDDLSMEQQAQAEILYGQGASLHEAHRFPQLKWIQAHSAGVDYLMDKPIWKGQALITTTTGIHPIPVSERALGLIFAFRCGMLTHWRYQARKEWPSLQRRREVFGVAELRGSILGIVGYGAIGRELARQAQALGLRVLALNRTGKRTTLRGYSEPNLGDPNAQIPEQVVAPDGLMKMVATCDYVVALAPLTTETRHMFDAAVFAAMKPSAFFFNLGRGAVMDEQALILALKNRQIAGAGLDVFETEPLPEDSPLWELENVIISPHLGGISERYDDRASDLFADNLRRFLQDEALVNLVERDRGY